MAGPRETVRNRMRFYKSSLFREAVAESLFEGADRVKASAQRLITAGSVSGKNHKPSVAPNPPHNDTGHLKSNIEVSQPEWNKARVTSKARYSSVHEFGNSTHPARPFLRPARDAEAPKVERRLKRNLNRAAKAFRP
jgi:hypothetical protein